MKKTFLHFIIFISAFVLYSCEEDFNLKTDYSPRYSLYCIIRADTTLHFSTISKSYMVEGFDPYAYKEDPFLSGADIRMWHRDDVFFFRDTTIPRADTARFTGFQKSYYLKDYRPAENDFLEIKAILQNGKVLQGTTRIPRKIKFDSTSASVIPVDGSDEFAINWTKNNNIGWFLLRLQLNYKKNGPSSPTESVILPVRYSGDTPVYPSATKNSGINFKWSAFDRTIRAIANDQPDKSRIIIYGISVELLVFDENLSKYYANFNGFMDDFTVRVDQNDYTNIEGGLGIFGSFIKQIGGIKVTDEYVTSLGYSLP